MWDVSDDPVDFDEAIAWFRELVPMSDEDFARLVDASHQHAFVVAGVAQLDVVTQVWEAIDRAVSDGTTFDDFVDSIGAVLESAWGGTVPAPGWRLETIFRTNVQKSYNAGRYIQATDPDTKEDRPYWRFEATLDSRTCFAAGTPVRMADGTDRSIEKIRPGDEVLSCRGRRRRVVAAVATPKRTWGTLRLVDGRELRLTPNHPILTEYGWIRAGFLNVGDRVVVQPDDAARLSDVWDTVQDRAPAAEVLPPRVPSLRDAIAALPPLRRTLPPLGNQGHSVLLQRGVQARGVQGRGESCSGRRTGAGLSDVREVVSPQRDTDPAIVLLRGLPGTTGLVPLVSQDVSSAAPIPRSRSVHVVLARLPRRGTTQGGSAFCNSAHVRKVRSVLSGSSGRRRQEPAVLLEEVPDDAGRDRLRHVRDEEASTADQSQRPILLGSLLPPFRRGDQSRGCGAGCAGAPWDRVRAGGEDRALERRLPCRPSLGCRGGRGLLALEAGRQGARRETGCATRNDGVSRPATVRERHSPRSGDGDPRAEALWPAPSDAVRGLATGVVVAVDWELTPSHEPAYDIQVEHDRGFIANGVVVHNSDLCEECDGTIRPADDAWWRGHIPPLHHACRSTLITLTEEQARRMGGVTKSPSRAKPDGDFGKPPDVTWAPDPNDYPAPLRPAANALKKAANE